MVKIRMQKNEEIEVIQIALREKIRTILSKREDCEEENDEESCMAKWDSKIEEKRAYFEELMEKVRETRDEETEFVR